LETRTFGNFPDRLLVLGLAVTVVALSVSACALDEPYQCRSMRTEWRTFNEEENALATTSRPRPTAAMQAQPPGQRHRRGHRT
jgi:hypothetical protein